MKFWATAQKFNSIVISIFRLKKKIIITTIFNRVQRQQRGKIFLTGSVGVSRVQKAGNLSPQLLKTKSGDSFVIDLTRKCMVNKKRTR